MVIGREDFFPIPSATYRTQASQLWRIKCRLHRLKPAAAREQHTPPVPPLLTTKEKVFNAVASISVAIHLYHAPPHGHILLAPLLNAFSIQYTCTESVYIKRL
jgi:hypothetical protein